MNPGSYLVRTKVLPGSQNGYFLRTRYGYGNQEVIISVNCIVILLALSVAVLSRVSTHSLVFFRYFQTLRLNK